MKSFTLLSFHFSEFLSENLRFFLVFLGRLLGILDLLFEVSDFFRELRLNVLELLFDLLKSGLQIVLFRRLLLVNGRQFTQLGFVLILRLLQLVVFRLNHCFLVRDLLTLLRDMLVHSLAFLFLLRLVLLHVLLQVRFQLFHVLNFDLLMLELGFCLLQFLMLISKPVDLSFELIRLLLFYHLNVALSNFLYLSQAGVAETIAGEVELNQASVFVKRFKHHGFNRLTEKVVCQLHLTDCLVLLQCANQVNQARIVEAARAEVEPLELGGGQNVTEELQDIVSQEIFATNQSLNRSFG